MNMVGGVCGFTQVILHAFQVYAYGGGMIFPEMVTLRHVRAGASNTNRLHLDG